MQRSTAWCLRFALVVAAVSMAVVTPATVYAQVYQGRLEITVVDNTGAVLPGVTVDISGPTIQSSVTDGQGQARFLNLEPGTYRVRGSLAGFQDFVQENVAVVAASAVPLRITLAVAGVQTAVTVSADSPMLDSKKQTTVTNVTLEELQGIPNARDPWVVMQTVPSIVVDRVNVGGSESGQQSNFTAKGSGRGDATWNVDGVPVTDMAATGATSTYFDFDSFQEISVTTGGADVQSGTAGVQLNFAMKTGTDALRGNARFYFENESMQSNNMPDDLAASIGGASGKGNRTDEYADYGFDVGGPLVPGRWWAWGSYGKTDVTIRTLTDVADQTILENYAFKTQAQLTNLLRGGFMYFRGDKLKFGRGASATRLDETTWNQSGPTSIYKPEFSFASSNLFVTARYAYADMGFTLDPRGGLEAGKEPYRDDAGVWHNSYVFYSTKRPQHTANADANYFKGNHEVKFGYAYRKFPVDSVSQWPGSRIITIHDGYPNLYIQVARDLRAKTEGLYQNFYIADTITRDRLTLNLGVRWDYATSSLLDNQVEGVPGFALLPSISAPGIKNAYKFSNLRPRLGATYALDETRKTIVRASYSDFSSQLGAAQASFVNPVSYSYIYYLGLDRNGDNIAQFNEILFDQGLQGYYGIDPDNPTSAISPNRIGDLTAPRTQEVLVGFDRELGPRFGMSGAVTYRHIDNQFFLPAPLIGLRQADYQQTGTFSGNEPETGAFNVPLYGPAAPLATAGRESVNRDGYHQRYVGFELSAVKRMSNRWMARLGFSTNSHTEHFDDPSQAISDPTSIRADPLRDGGPVITRSTGSGKSDIYLILPKYQFVANGLFQAAWGLNFGFNYVGRQGYGQPWFQDRISTGDPTGSKIVLFAPDLDGDRLPAVHSLDVRAEKALRFGRTNINVALDVFNIANSATVLGRQFNRRFPRTSATGFGRTLEIMNPRIARLGIRLSF
jgi:hypothetical protein